MDGDNQVAIDFLLKFHEEGPYTLVAIGVDSPNITGRTFQDEEGMEEWLRAHNGVDNCYFHVNQLKEILHKKGTLRDIDNVGWFHVDVDPEAGDLAEQQADCLLRLTSHDPPPTCVIFSGGGYQGFWKLDEPIEVLGDEAQAREVGRYNQQIQNSLKADNCHNVDRIMRLPGTINIPNRRKREKGRIEALARVVQWNTSRVYNKDAFIQAVLHQASNGNGFAGATPLVTANITQLPSIDSLDNYMTVPPKLKVIIVQGDDPENPDKYASRSEALFAVVTQLLKGGVPDDVVYSVIIDDRWRISDSILEKGGNIERYALRQIEKAKEYVVAPELAELNAKHAVIEDFGGKCVVVSELWDDCLKRHGLSKQSFGAFKDRYSNRLVAISAPDENGDQNWMQLGRWWLSQRMRRQFEQIVFAPEKEVKNAYNLWRGFACDAIKGDCELFLVHIRDNVCGGDEECYEYILNWMARVVQHPDTPGEVAVVLRGSMGTGKGIFCRLFGGLFGRHYCYVSDGKHLVGNFNSHLRDAVLIFADEAFFAGDKQHANVLKALVTEQMLRIEHKGVDSVQSPNYTHIIMASNSDWVVPAEIDDRRFFVMDMGEKSKQKREYFTPMIKQMEKQGGSAALLHYLMYRDIKEFDVGEYPKTDALNEQKKRTLSPEVDWWLSILQDGRLTNETDRWEDSVPKLHLYNDYISYVKDLGSVRRMSKISFRTFLEKIIPGDTLVTKRVNIGYDSHTSSSRPWCYVIPALQKCREEFIKIYPSIVSEWQDDDDAKF